MNSSSAPLFDSYIGDPSDIFYQYAAKRKKETQRLIEIYQKTLKIEPFSRVASVYAPFAKILKQKISKEMTDILEAFAAGSERELDEIKLLMYLPDFLAAYHHFTPELMGLIPGCSSLIYLDDNKNANHIRVLDFSITEFFKDNEELVRFEMPNCHKFYSASLKGFPLSLFTVGNEHGLTLALHQRVSQKWNKDGENIFSIMLKIITQAKDITEVKELLKSTESLTNWGIVALDSNHQILHAELGGHEHLFESYHLAKDNFFYFNRLSIKKSATSLASLIKLSEKQKSFIDKSFESIQKKHINNFDIFENLTNHFNEMPVENNLLTLSSVQAINLCPDQDQVIMKIGAAPKVDGSYYQFDNLFSHTQEKIIESVKVGKVLTDFNQGLLRIARAQSLYDIGEKESAYHEIQMGSALIEEGPLYFISRFIFLVWQYSAFKNKNDLIGVYQELKLIHDKLPETLADHARLFIMRIEKLISFKVSIKEEDIKSEVLKEVYNNEIKLRPRALKLLKYLIFPRLELFDIIYLY